MSQTGSCMSTPETSAHHPAYFTPQSPTEGCQPGSQLQRDERGMGEAGGGGWVEVRAEEGLVKKRFLCY